MEFCDLLEGLHGGQGTFRVFLELLVVLAVPVHLAVPFEPAAAQGGRVDLQQKRPDTLPVEEVLEAFSATVLQQLSQTRYTFLGLSSMHLLHS